MRKSAEHDVTVNFMIEAVILLRILRLSDLMNELEIWINLKRALKALL